MTSSAITNWMKQYTFQKCFLWLQTTAIHPNNQTYQMRFEYLVACLLTIEDDKFENKTLSHSAYKKFIRTFIKESNSEFMMLEDFSSFPQLQLIPYFYNGRKYFFFYGNLERPWEFLYKLDHAYIKRPYQTNIDMEEIFLFSMEFQTKLLMQLASLEESQHVVEGIYIPSEEYLELIGEFFVCHNIIDGLNPLSASKFSLDIVDRSKGMVYEAFDALFVYRANQYIFLLPQMHIEALFKILDHEIFEMASAKENLAVANNCAKAELDLRCRSFFGKGSITDIVDIQKISLLQENEIAIRVEENHILIFHILRTRHHTAFNMDSGIKKVKNRLEEIKRHYLLGIGPSASESSLVPAEELTIQGIIIFQYTGINALPFGVNDLSVPFYSLDDIIRIFEFLRSPVEFINYVRESRAFHQRTHIIATDTIDEFAAYLENGKIFLAAGKYPDHFMIEPHFWHDHYMDFLFKEYTENGQIHEFVESLRPYYFDHIEKVGDCVYDVFNKADLLGGSAILLPDKTYLITSMITGDRNHRQISEKFLNPLFCEYLVTLDMAFNRAIFSFMADTMPKIIHVDLIPHEAVRSDNLPFLEEELTEMDGSNPLHITVRWRKPNEPHIFVLFDSEHMDTIFSNETNIGERITVKKLLLALLRYFINLDGEDIDSIADTFVDKYVPVGKRRFGVEALIIENPRLPDYRSHIKADNTDMSKVKRQIAEHIASMEYLPGIYCGDEAKKLIKAIYHLLQEELEKRIASFGHSFIRFSYIQLEYAEGKMAEARRKAKIDNKTQTDFDIIQKYTETSNEISLDTMAIKHILTSALKVNPSGSTTITSIEWREIFAIACNVIEVTQLFDFVEYSLTDCSIDVSEMYEINEKTSDPIFDAQKYAYEVNRDLLFTGVETSSLSDAKILDYHLVNDAFSAAYGFTFQEMETILYFLGNFDFEHTIDYPLNVMGENSLIEILSGNYPEIHRDTFKRIVTFLSLETTTYNPDSILIPSLLMRKKERLNLCPIIHINDTLIWGNQMCVSSAYFWNGSVVSGDFPYSIDCPKGIETAMKAVHTQNDKDLEVRLARIAREVLGGEYVFSPLLKFDSINKKLQRFPECGEIDILAILSSAKKIIIGEAKNRNKRARAYDMQLEHRDFFDENKGYYTKLKKKAAFVEDNLHLFLEQFAVDDIDDWIVEPLFLVSKVYTAAFLGHDVKFVLEDNFKQYLLDQMSGL